jgi:hypothetical protein
MRIAVLSDIHSNAAALKEALISLPKEMLIITCFLATTLATIHGLLKLTIY